VAALAVILIMAVLALVFSKPVPPPPLPNPNGYDDFMNAGRMLIGEPSDFPVWTNTQLAEFVAKNTNAFALIASGLKKETRAPPVRNEQQVQDLLTRLARFKQLAQALAAKARLAAEEGRSADAATISLDGIEFSQAIMRGGVMIEGLVGIASEAIAESQLARAITNLDASAARTVARRLIELDARAPSADEILQNERAFSRSVGGVVTRLSALIQRVLRRDLLAAAYAKFKTRMNARVLRRGELILQAGARAFELEKGRPPQAATELVPDYLPAVPTDPATGAALKYP
jgi:hypothetical protein